MLIFLLLFVSGVSCQLEVFPLESGSSQFIDKSEANEPSPEIFCYRGIDLMPWHVWRTAEVFIAFSEKSNEKDSFQYFISDSPKGAKELWERAQLEATPIVNWLSSVIFQWPIKFFWGVSGNSLNSTLDRLLSSPPYVALDPFKPSCIAISSIKSYTATVHISKISLSLALITAVGCGLFLSAPLLVSSEAFYYTSASGLGILSFALIAVFLIIRFAPMRRPLFCIAAVLGSSALWVGMTRRVIEFLSVHLYIAVGFVITSAAIGFAVGYWYGPPSSTRIKNLLSWFLQAIGLALMTFGTFNVPYISVLLFIACLVYRNLKYLKNIEIPLKFRLLFYRVFPPNRRYLTQDEYEKQGREETERQVRYLRNYVSSPDCNPWDIVQRLKDPVEFAKYISPATTPVGHFASLRQSQGNGHLNTFSDDDDDFCESENTSFEDNSMEVDGEVLSDDDD